MNIGIVGCGWIGLKIAKKLSVKNCIFSTTTRKEKISSLEKYNPTLISFSDNFLQENLPWKHINKLDVLIITIPFSERRNSIKALETRFKNLACFIGDFKGQLFFMSSTGVYPKTFKTFYEKDLASEDVFMENLIKSNYPSVNILRLAGLMGEDRLLKKYSVTNLNDVVNHIHFKDVCLVIEEMIFKKTIAKLYNVVAPKHPIKANVVNNQLNLPLQKEKTTQKRVISSEKLILELGFKFKYPDPLTFHL